MSSIITGKINNIDLLNFIITIHLNNDLGNPAKIICGQHIELNEGNKKIEGKAIEIDFSKNLIKIQSKEFVYFLFKSFDVEIIY